MTERPLLGKHIQEETADSSAWETAAFPPDMCRAIEFSLGDFREGDAPAEPRGKLRTLLLLRLGRGRALPSSNPPRIRQAIAPLTRVGGLDPRITGA